MQVKGVAIEVIGCVLWGGQMALWKNQHARQYDAPTLRLRGVSDGLGMVRQVCRRGEAGAGSTCRGPKCSAVCLRD